MEFVASVENFLALVAFFRMNLTVAWVKLIGPFSF